AAILITVVIGLIVYLYPDTETSFSAHTPQPQEISGSQDASSSLPQVTVEPAGLAVPADIIPEDEVNPSESRENEDTVTQVRPPESLPATVTPGPVSEVIPLSGGDGQAGPADVAENTAVSEALSTANMVREPVFQLQIIADPRLSVEDFELMNRQLEELPPESAEYEPSSLQSEVC
ncbi:MAG: hypothetical protein GTO60_02305, partial [Gammaproteobacteria bacterium]|nr:hypothetical protein [Gammaproteobacteria bacterium]